MVKKYGSVVWDIETASADDLFSYSGKYVRLVGYQIDDEAPVVTTDVESLIEILLNCERHYGFNSLSFDCVALSLYHDVDYLELTENHVDLMLIERQLNPPEARRNYPRGYWGLDQTAKRYGHSGKTDDLKKLAAKHGGFDNIPVDDDEYVSYTYGDIETTRFLVDKIGHEYDTDPYLPREHEVMRRIYLGCRIIGMKVDVEELARRREEQASRREVNFRKLESKYGIPLKTRVTTTFSNPFRVQEGKDWFTSRCADLGIEGFPRTSKGTVSLTSKNVGKVLASQTDPDSIDFLSCVLGAMGDDKDAIAYLNTEYGLPLERVEVIESKSPLRTTAGQRALHAYLRKLGMYLPRTEKSTFTLEDGTELRQYSTTKDDLHEAVALYSSPERLRERRVRPPRPEILEQFKELVEVIIDVTTERTVYDTIENNRVGDRIHPQIFPDQSTGRWGFKNPGITVMGKKGGKQKEREVIVADEGNVLCCLDLGQIDSRIVAGLSQDTNYMSLFEPGKDLHSEVAMLIFGRCDGEWRDRAKAGSHGANYSMGVNAMINILGLEREVAETFDREWKRKFPLVEKWKQQAREIAERGYTMLGIAGRKMKPDTERYYTQGPGLLGQNGCREIMSEGLLKLPLELIPMLRGVIHDEYVFELPQDWAEDLTEVILECIQGEFRGVDIIADASPFGKNWGECYG